VGLVASIGFLKNRKRSWDRVAYASTEIGVLFCTLVLITGPIWAKPIWKVWWQWDGRLTSTLVMWFTYVGYLAVRALAEDRAQAARWSAVLAIVAWLNIPIVHMSVKWWYSLHPQSKIFRERLGGGLEEGMGEALIAGLIAFSTVYLGLFFLRLTLERLSDEREEAQARS
jgi:heme exporter protein C